MQRIALEKNNYLHNVPRLCTCVLFDIPRKFLGVLVITVASTQICQNGVLLHFIATNIHTSKNLSKYPRLFFDTKVRTGNVDT